MTRVDCRFALSGFQLDSPWGEDDQFFLLLWGEGMSLEFNDLEADALGYLIDEIEQGLRTSEKYRKAADIDELLYQPPPSSPLRLCVVFESVGGLQALYQPADKLWEMVFDDMAEDGGQAHVMMSSRQVFSLLAKLKEAVQKGETGEIFEGGENQ